MSLPRKSNESLEAMANADELTKIIKKKSKIFIFK